MLHELSITNFAIIDELHVSFAEGLNIISGETGAGKSILIGAVSLLFTAGAELVIRRVISRTGKNRVQINGQMATLANLAQISESLINICGQHEHQVILYSENHIDILDEFGGFLAERKAYEDIYSRHQQICGRIDKLEDLCRHREEKTDLIEFQLTEINNLNPHAGEDAALAEEKKVLSNVQKLADWSDRAYSLLYAESGCISAQLKEVLARIDDIQKIDPGLRLSHSDMENSYATLQEAALVLRDYRGKLVFDPGRIAAIDDRLDAINRLKRKHGGTLDAMLVRKREMEEELQQVSGVEEELLRLRQEKDAVAGDLREKAIVLSKLRTQAAAQLKDAVDAEIHDLNMPHAGFFVHFLSRCSEEEISYGPKGGDVIEFYLTANAGEEPKALSKIVSGGELSRIVLALKNVLSQTGSVATVVFDEVDSGIGGATAEIVGRKLQDISAHHQVICITHLPQIASFGGRHLRVTKRVVSGRTSAMVEEIDEQQKIEEIGRMLGGVDVTETAKDHARELLAAAKAARVSPGRGRRRHAEKSAHQ
ncbi:MAG: DNA repair protein RecN [Deltaproteobacteria bacterium HGW-Deltaproteobacteria-1]|nr:MAG: DNA repair protein RecN [Deltaproteobacteria bacterium HGW-Deltaproteobacteria-1]